MKTTLISLALAVAAMAKPMPQVYTPEGCSPSAPGSFEVHAVDATTVAKRDFQKRRLAGVLTLTLNDGILKDQAGRTGYIASNYQWQFDAPPQENALSTSGYSLCANNTLALGGSAVFYQCRSGDFYNLYDRYWAAQCSPIFLVATSAGGAAPISQISDGQPQATTALPISQISDGQPQAPTAYPPISQISDGQPQAPTPAPTAPYTHPVSQISDGQPQAPVPATSVFTPMYPTPPVVTPISDGQSQVPIATGTGNYTAPTSTPAQFTGAAPTAAYGLGALAAGLMGGVIAML